MGVSIGANQLWLDGRIDSERVNMSKGIDDLKHEHEAILVSLQILGSMSERLLLGQAVESKDIGDFVGFLKEFADKCHHRKEEGILFPAMVAAGVAEQGGPIGVMLHEHIEGRVLIKQMEASIKPELNSAAFIKAVRDYSELLTEHIQKENNVLFPMAERVLSAAKLDSLHADFESHESKVMGAGRHEQLHNFLRAMKGKYLF